MLSSAAQCPKRNYGALRGRAKQKVSHDVMRAVPFAARVAHEDNACLLERPPLRALAWSIAQPRTRL